MGLNSRNSDPRTSHAAESMLHHYKNRHIGIVYRALLSEPATQSELADKCGLRPDQVWRRISDLKNMGLIFDTGETRYGDSGRPQIVWSSTSQKVEKNQLDLL